MNKSKFTLGILLTILGGIVCITSMVFGIIHIAEKTYEDIYIFPAKLSISEYPLKEALRTNSFTVKSKNLISIWLKMPDRQIENKDFIITGFLREQAGKIIANFEENFKFGYLRSSYGQGQYYRLSKHYFENDSSIYLSYTTSGTWSPPYDGSLVIRQSKSISLPLKEMGVFTLGVFVLIIGIGTIIKNK